MWSRLYVFSDLKFVDYFFVLNLNNVLFTASLNSQNNKEYITDNLAAIALKLHSN